MPHRGQPGAGAHPADRQLDRIGHAVVAADAVRFDGADKGRFGLVAEVQNAATQPVHRVHLVVKLAKIDSRQAHHHADQDSRKDAGFNEHWGDSF